MPSSGGYPYGTQEYYGSQMGDPEDMMMFGDGFASPRQTYY